jgi:RNA polymerase sigma factor (sigma-70 family)
MNHSNQIAGRCWNKDSVNLHDRNSLIEKHLPRIRLIARQLRYSLPPSVDIDDLVAAAALAMIRALDEGRFWTWARVRGAMLDLIREAHENRRAAMPPDVIAETQNPEQLAIRSEAVLNVQRNAATLTERERQVISLAAAGAGGQRIARELNISDRRVRKLKESAIERLEAAA